jgi:hypothetical protein
MKKIFMLFFMIAAFTFSEADPTKGGDAAF